MNFIKKMFEKKADEDVHLQFQKFSKGEFRNRAVIQAKSSKGKYKINTSAEFANNLVKTMAEKLGDKKTLITGGIITTVNLKEIPQYSKLLANVRVKQFQGVKNYSLNLELSGKEIINIINSFPKAFFALSFKTEDSELKIKPKAPKSGKPSNKKDEMPKADFCKLITTDKTLGESFVFEKPDFQKAEISHIYMIKELVLPKGEKDFSKIRELAKRKGEIIRKANIDGEEIITKIELEA